MSTLVFVIFYQLFGHFKLIKLPILFILDVFNSNQWISRHFLRYYLWYEKWLEENRRHSSFLIRNKLSCYNKVLFYSPYENCFQDGYVFSKLPDLLFVLIFSVSKDNIIWMITYSGFKILEDLENPFSVADKTIFTSTDGINLERFSSKEVDWDCFFFTTWTSSSELWLSSVLEGY